jgi:NAD(P)H dehydrogenase (quinone)
MSIIVTGASGHLGRRVAELLLERVAPQEVVLVSRDPQRLADLAQGGADVRRGDFTDPGTLAGAFAGGERMLLVSTDAIAVRVDHHRSAIQAAADAGVRFVAYTSVVNPTEANPAFMVPDHRATEQMLRESGLEWCFLRNAIYAETQVEAAAAAVDTGRLVTNAGDGGCAYVAREDCAAAGAAVVAGGDHAGKAYDIAGPKSLDATALAEIFGQLADRGVEAIPVDDGALVELLVAAGTPEPVAQALATIGRATREGCFDVRSSDVETLSGRPPRTLRSVLEEHRDQILLLAGRR